MVSSIAIGLGFSTLRGSGGPAGMSKIDALALRGVVAAALPPSTVTYDSPLPGRDGARSQSLDQVVPWHFIR
jgi:hypothetical protein